MSAPPSLKNAAFIGILRILTRFCSRLFTPFRWSIIGQGRSRTQAAVAQRRLHRLSRLVEVL